MQRPSHVALLDPRAVVVTVFEGKRALPDQGWLLRKAGVAQGGRGVGGGGTSALRKSQSGITKKRENVWWWHGIPFFFYGLDPDELA